MLPYFPKSRLLPPFPIQTNSFSEVFHLSLTLTRTLTIHQQLPDLDFATWGWVWVPEWFKFLFFEKSKYNIFFCERIQHGEECGQINVTPLSRWLNEISETWIDDMINFERPRYPSLKFLDQQKVLFVDGMFFIDWKERWQEWETKPFSQQAQLRWMVAKQYDYFSTAELYLFVS